MPSWETALLGVVVAGRYRVQKQLASGGFGAVYIAEQLATEHLVALKVLWPHVLESKSARAQFALEARIASRIASENVVQVLDAGVDEENDVTFLVMELLQGQNLEDLVYDHGPPTRPLALEYLQQTAAALDKAHRYLDRDGRPAPIVHRDLKPDNLFVTAREDGTPMLKVLDFGIAKVLSASMQMSAEVKGTPTYMAYEQASRGTISPATDIWAFGLVAFFLFTGKNYWRAANSPDGSMPQLFGEVLTLPIEPASVRAEELAVASALPPGFDDWFRRCVHRDQSQRFQSIAEAMRELSALHGRADLGLTRLRPATPAMAVRVADAATASTLEPETLAATMSEAQSTVDPPLEKRPLAARLRAPLLTLGLCVVGATIFALWRTGADSAVSREAPTPPRASVGRQVEATPPVAAAISTPQTSASAPLAGVPASAEAVATKASPSARANATNATNAAVSQPQRLLPARPAVRPPAAVHRAAKDDVYSDR